MLSRLASRLLPRALRLTTIRSLLWTGFAGTIVLLTAAGVGGVLSLRATAARSEREVTALYRELSDVQQVVDAITREIVIGSVGRASGP